MPQKIPSVLFTILTSLLSLVMCRVRNEAPTEDQGRAGWRGLLHMWILNIGSMLVTEGNGNIWTEANANVTGHTQLLCDSAKALAVVSLGSISRMNFTL
jgi:hypothetical protein